MRFPVPLVGVAEQFVFLSAIANGMGGVVRMIVLL